MAMKDYKVTYTDGTETFVQIDDSEEVGKAILDSYKTAVKADDSDVKSIEAASPPKTSSPELQKG